MDLRGTRLPAEAERRDELPPSVLQQRAPLGDLLDVKSFAEVCQSFAELYRVGVKVFDAEGHKLVDVKVGNADFCGYIW